MRAFLSDYSIGELESFEGIAEGIENTNYLIKTNHKPYILTLFEKRVDPDDLPFFVNLMDHLAARSVPCPQPIARRQGGPLGALAGRPSLIVSFLEGRPPKEFRPVHLRELGQALAKLHLAGADFRGERENDLKVEGWAKLVDACRNRADEVAKGLSGLIQEELALHQANWPADLPRGVIHADLFHDNVFFQGDKLTGIIDFYFACTDSLVYDLAVTLNDWCFSREGQYDLELGRAFFAGYESLRPLSAEERSALPQLARGAALRFLLTRLYDWLNHDESALVTPKNPNEYIAKLRFHQAATTPDAYGA